MTDADSDNDVLQDRVLVVSRESEGEYDCESVGVSDRRVMVTVSDLVWRVRLGVRVRRRVAERDFVRVTSPDMETESEGVSVSLLDSSGVSEFGVADVEAVCITVSDCDVDRVFKPLIEDDIVIVLLKDLGLLSVAVNDAESVVVAVSDADGERENDDEVVRVSVLLGDRVTDIDRNC